MTCLQASKKASKPIMPDRKAGRAEIEFRTAAIPNSAIKTVAGAGHMLQHDQPEEVARLIEEFL